MADAATAKLDVGKVISGTFTVLGGNLVNLLIVAGLLLAAPSVLSGLLQLSFGGSTVALVASPAYWLLLLVAIAAMSVGYGALIWLSGEQIAGRKAGWVESLRVALPRAPALLGLFLLQYFAIVLGLVFLIVPGVMLAIAWSVTLPALVVDKTGVFESFGVSRRLTKGNRWRILGLFLIYAVGLGIASAIAVQAGAAGVATGLNAFGLLLVVPLLNAAIYTLSTTGMTVLHNELKILKDGAGAASLAQIFD